MWSETLRKAREGKYNALDHDIARWEDEGGQSDSDTSPQSNQYAIPESQKVRR